MALVHAAELTPRKLDMLRAWLPTRPWGCKTDDICILGTFRFDDPDGAVGIETFLIASSGRVLQVPVTYRGASLPSAQDSLITTMEHSVLGRRWAYDGAADPVYVKALATAILTGGSQAEIEYDYEVPPERRIITTHVTGTGSEESEVPVIGSISSTDTGDSTLIAAEKTHIDLARVVDTTRSTTSMPALTGTWPGQSDPVVLAGIRTHLS